MVRQRVDIKRYVQLINAKLEEHPGYRDGMRVSLAPGSNAAHYRLYLRDGASPGDRAVFIWALGEVNNNYEPTPRIAVSH